MKPFFREILQPDAEAAARIEGDIVKFTPDLSYSTGNFSLLRDKHAQLQLDSVNGTTDRLNTILERTNWPAPFFKDKLVLECGCGAGPDTEVLLKLGAKVVAVDLAGLERAQNNLKNNENLQLVQGDITNLPFQPKSFDIVFCHRVIQHTPDPSKTLNHILSFVKDDGAAFVHSYARTMQQMWNWKYALLPLTRRMNPDKLYSLVEKSAPCLFKLTSALYKLRRPGFILARVFVPFYNYRHKKKFIGKSDKFIIEFGIHDTFDALSPPYDSPLSLQRMQTIAAAHLKRPYEVVHASRRTITLLRSVVN